MAGIKSWSEDDRPREKLMLKGANALSNSELLAILINNGTKNKTAVDVAKDLLAKVDNDLQRIGRLSVKEMIKMKVKGLGPAKAISIAAALELGIRRDSAYKKKEKILSSRDIADFLKAQFQYHTREVFVVIFMNQANKIMHHEIISEGGITGTIADPRIILQKALEHNATAIILCHNHPSGNLKPSRQDELLTNKIKTAASYFDIVVSDHIIVSNEGYFSFADEGML
ncbi:MAG: DNA repair protein RadC [Chitinophagaceae bacterium]|nr:DNA repair protein RadC [Chitinophagaceae bacterium]